MKEVQRLTTKQRIIRNALIILASAVVGAVCGFFSANLADAKLPTFLSRQTLFSLVTGLYFFVAVLTVAFMYRTNRFYKVYQTFEEEDDEGDDFYRLTFRNLEYANITYNVSIALALFITFGRVQSLEKIIDNNLPLFTGMELLIFLVMIVLQVFIFKLTQKVRRYKMSSFPTVAEVKQFAYSFDEGELQANYEQAFDTLFELNQKILPAIYVTLFFVGFFTSVSVLSGFVAVMLIHVYINIANIKMVRKYFS